MQITVPNLLSGAHFELNTYQPTATLTAPDGVISLLILNELMDSWNAVREKVWAERFDTFTLVLHQPITIGPTGDFVLTERPPDPDGFSLLLTNVTPAVKVSINIRDYQWFLQQPVFNTTYANTIQSSIITDIYYQPDWPNGKLYCFPAPNTAYSLVTVTRNLLTSTLTVSDTLDLPQGYQRAVRLTLAEWLCTGFGRTVPEKLALDAAHARAIIDANNIQIPTLVTRDGGMPGGQQHRPDFWWANGSIR